MRMRPGFEVLPTLRSDRDPVQLDPFHEDLIRRDLAKFSGEPNIFAQYVERARIRFQKASERAVLERWISFYQVADRLVVAKTAMERGKSEYQQLAREHELKETEKCTNIAKLQADMEEHQLRRDKAAYQRRHLESFVDGGAGRVSENEQHLNDAFEHRNLDARWEVNESLRPLQTLVELQHWRRKQRDKILADRSLSSHEQGEDLQFIDDLYAQKRGELKADTRIFEESI